MPVNSTHPDYDVILPAWLRARDVVAGEDAVKAASEKYLPRLDAQSEDDDRGYKSRASFFNAAARTAEGFVGLIFQRDPVVRVPSNKDTLSVMLAKCVEDLDLLGTALPAYARNVIEEVVIVGRCGTLVDWCPCRSASRTGHEEERAYASLCRAEEIRNWRVERVNGRNVLTLLVLSETVSVQALQWPRAECRDPDRREDLASDAAPSAVVQATCELARELLIKDRTAAPAGEGLSYQNVGSAQTGYDKSDTPPVIPRVVQAMLGKLGSLLKARSGVVRLVRT